MPHNVHESHERPADGRAGFPTSQPYPSHRRMKDATENHVVHPILVKPQSTLESLGLTKLASGLQRALPPIAFSSASRRAPGQSSHSQTPQVYGSFVKPPSTTNIPNLLHQHHPSEQSPAQTVIDPFDMVANHSESKEDQLLNEIQWSSWDELSTKDAGRRRVLLLGYPDALQMWDVTTMEAVRDLFHLPTSSFIRDSAGQDRQSWTVAQAIVLRDPPLRSPSPDAFAELRPLMGLVLRDSLQAHPTCRTQVVIYSLKTYEVVKRLTTELAHSDDPMTSPYHESFDPTTDPDYSKVVRIAANGHFVLISTHSPPTIHILSSSTLGLLHTIPHQQLTASVASSKAGMAEPIFTLSPGLGKWLAVASPPPLPHHRQRHPGPGYRSSNDKPTSTSTMAANAISVSMTSLGGLGAGSVATGAAAAKRVGEGVLSGMRALSGYVARATAATPLTPLEGDRNVHPIPTYPNPATQPTFTSRSAPSPAPAMFSNSSYGSSPSPAPDPSRLAVYGSPLPSSPTIGAVPLRSPTGGTYPRYYAGGESVLNPPVESGYISVLDLAPLLFPSNTKQSRDLKDTIRPEFVRGPRQVAHFHATAPTSGAINGTGPAIKTVSFSPSGTMLCVSDVHGHLAKVFQIRGASRAARSVVADGTHHDQSGTSVSSSYNTRAKRREGSSAGTSARSADFRRRSSGASSASTTSTANAGSSPGDDIWHLYDLHRGTTTAQVEAFVWSNDARWIGMVTAKGTIHVFAINPYGGQPDAKSHLSGRVQNPGQLQPLSVQLRPIAQMKPLPGSSLASSLGRSPIPTCVFMPNSMSRALSFGDSTQLPTSAQQAISSLQDVLAFTEGSGELVLRRLVVSEAEDDTGSEGGATTSDLAKQRRASMPVPSTSAAINRALPISGVSLMMRKAEVRGLQAKESQLALWPLRRQTNWAQVMEPMVNDNSDALHSSDPNEPRRISLPLSQAELTTSSRSLQILPPSIYLSHQFNFFTILGQDYEALLQLNRFETVPVRKIEVRREVEVSPNSALSPYQHPRDIMDVFTGATALDLGIRNTTQHNLDDGPSSFDGQLASAIKTELDPSGGRAVIPAFPNAWNNGRTPSVAAPIIRTMTDGVNELKSQLVKATVKRRSRSPHHQGRRGRRSGSGQEEDLIFEEDPEEMYTQDQSDSIIDVTRGRTAGVGDESTPSGSTANMDSWDEDPSDNEAYIRAIEHDEKFDDVGAAAFTMAEEEKKERETLIAEARAASNPIQAKRTVNPNKKKKKR